MDPDSYMRAVGRLAAQPVCWVLDMGMLACRACLIEEGGAQDTQAFVKDAASLRDGERHWQGQRGLG